MDVIYIGKQGTPTTQQGVETDRDRALEHMKKILRETVGSIYKVGISSNPSGRTYGHQRVAVDERREGDMIYVTIQVGLWSKMYVIFQTLLEEEIRRAEREFIAEAKKDFGDYKTSNIVTMNENPGGEGPLRATGPYFLYVLRSAG